MPPRIDGAGGRLGELARLFLRLGATAFGGPAAHIALTRHEVVARRQWLTDEEFLDVVGATNLLPGPNSTEVVMHIGARRAGWRGLVVAGACFIVPAAVLVTVVAWQYERHGASDVFEDIRYGVLPVVVAVVVHALWQLGRVVVRRAVGVAIAAAALAAWLAGVHELIILAGAAIVGGGWRAWVNRGRGSRTLGIFPLWIVAAAAAPASVGLWPLFWVFLRIGAVLYGSGYVLVAFLEGELVDRLGWLTSTQVLDAVAVGQVTPGPVFTTATFVGYQVAGLAGAAVATVAIFLPAFVFVAALDPVVRWVRARPWAAAALDGLQAAAVGLIGAVVIRLADDAFTDVLTVGLAVVAVGVLLRWRPNPAWVVLGGVAIGVVRAVVG